MLVGFSVTIFDHCPARSSFCLTVSIVILHSDVTTAAEIMQ